MAEYDNSNSGALFENERKTTKNHPDFRGSCTIQTPDGELVEYWVSGWEKTSKKGAPFVSLSFTMKEEQEERATPARKSGGLIGRKQRDEDEELVQKPKSRKPVDEDLDDSLPF